MAVSTLLTIVIAVAAIWAFLSIIGLTLTRVKRRRMSESNQMTNDLYESMGRDAAAQSLASGLSNPTEAAKFLADQAEYNQLLTRLPLTERVKVEEEMQPLGGDFGLRVAYLRRVLG